MRKFLEIDSQGKILHESKINIDISKVKIDQNKRSEASKRIEVREVQVNTLEGGKNEPIQLMKITSEAITSKKRKIRITTFYYKNKNLYYDAQIYTLILEDPDDTTKRLFYTVANIYPKDRQALEQFDLIVAKDKVSLETHYKILSSIIGKESAKRGRIRSNN
ncbi:hypothetical protein [Saccharolobus islandicus]|uniref:hypothetical protein n=1 Tax=Saccharolobus islandicus TaxID=43080 RepID=UPI000366CD11|nr:hypothetical protein [Sulfolobus islandicus]